MEAVDGETTEEKPVDRTSSGYPGEAIGCFTQRFLARFRRVFESFSDPFSIPFSGKWSQKHSEKSTENGYRVKPPLRRQTMSKFFIWIMKWLSTSHLPRPV